MHHMTNLVDFECMYSPLMRVRHICDETLSVHVQILIAAFVFLGMGKCADGCGTESCAVSVRMSSHIEFSVPDMFNKTFMCVCRCVDQC